MDKEHVEVKATYEKDTKRYHRFSIDSPEVSGVIYIRKDADLPKEVRVKLHVEGNVPHQK